MTMVHPGPRDTMTIMRAFNNILIIKPGAIGDLLQLTPVIRALKGRYPQAKISLVAGSHATATLFAHNPLVFETIVFDKNGAHRSVLSLVKLWNTLRKKQYDLVLNFQRSNLKTWLLASAAFPCRVLVYHKARNRNIHAVTNYLETIAPLGISTKDTRLELFPGDEDRAFAERLFASLGLHGSPVVALNPGASHPVNRWSADQFAALADLVAERTSAKTIIIGGTGDVPLAREIIAQSRSKPLTVAGQTTLLQLGALLARCDVLVTGDTGPMHMATAVRTRVVALFGAADPQRTGPVGSGHIMLRAENVSCVPCRKRSCASSRYPACMDAISADEVLAAVLTILQRRP